MKKRSSNLFAISSVLELLAETWYFVYTDYKKEDSRCVCSVVIEFINRINIIQLLKPIITEAGDGLSGLGMGLVAHK